MILELEENAFHISENFITSSYKLSLTELNWSMQHVNADVRVTLWEKKNTYKDKRRLY